MSLTVRGSAPFRPRARLMHLLGDELISDEVMAVIELVKNAYDADARKVTVGLYRLGDPGATWFMVHDDGDGMDLDTVLHGWLEPATDRKRRGQRKRRTALGRYPLGEKGVGRFAVNKLGAELELVTRARGQEHEVRLDVCWDTFGDGYLDEVQNHFERRVPAIFRGDQHGTFLRIGRARAAWDEARVARLRDGLARLVSPFVTLHDFQISMDCPDFPALAGPVTSGLLEHAPYRLVGRVDAAGVLEPEEGLEGPVDLRSLAPEIFLEGGTYRSPRCGPFRVALFVWDLDSIGLRRAAIDRSMRAALRRACGVSLYRDGFRVLPYGTPGDDWLELNQRRVNNPTMRVSTNQVVGVVEISQEHNPDLRDRTSREGLIDTSALHDLKALLVAALACLEERRFATRQAEARDLAVNDESDPVLRLLREARGRAAVGGGSALLVDRATAAYRQRLRELEIRQEYLMRLAGIGLAAEQISGEIGRTVSAAGTALRIVRNALAHGPAGEDQSRRLQQVESWLAFLGEQLDVLAPFYAGPATAEAEPLDLRSAVQSAAVVFAHRLRQENVRLVIEATEPVSVRMARAHLLQVLLHLFDNALHWIVRAPAGRAPEIRVRLLTRPVGFIFADSGPGIRPEHRDQIFRPFFTARSDGRGLGLHLVKVLMESYGFSVELLAEPLLLAGANLRFELSR